MLNCRFRGFNFDKWVRILDFAHHTTVWSVRLYVEVLKLLVVCLVFDCALYMGSMLFRVLNGCPYPMLGSIYICTIPPMYNPNHTYYPHNTDLKTC